MASRLVGKPRQKMEQDVEAALDRKDYGTVIRLVHECSVACQVKRDVIV